MTKAILRRTISALAAGAGGLTLMAGMAQADIVHADDVIIQGSLCVGLDCVSGEAFGFDTIRLKENNTQVAADDTSVGAFPANDWALTFNDSASGGQNKFTVRDVTAARNIFTVENAAADNSVYVDSTSRVGFRTATPVLDLHVATGNTPGLRLEQNGSAGFTAQTWDVAGNEANFFVRDVTGGSRLPFRIRPGAPTSSIDVAANGNVGLGTASPDDILNIERATGPIAIRFTSGEATAPNPVRLNFNPAQNEFRITYDGLGINQLRLNNAGNLTIAGSLVTTGGGGACTVGDPCDKVFDPEVYTVPSIEEHAALMWENQYLPAVGPISADQPIDMTVTMLRMLNELEKAHIYIDQLNARLSELENAPPAADIVQ